MDMIFSMIIITFITKFENLSALIPPKVEVVNMELPIFDVFYNYLREI